jgi:hypothetical protein
MPVAEGGGMGRGDRKTIRWARDRERRKKEREARKAQERAAQRKAR